MTRPAIRWTGILWALGLSMLVWAALFTALRAGEEDCWLRGDANRDGEWSITDVVELVNVIQHAPNIVGPCFDYGDANGDGYLSMEDPYYLLAYLFCGGPAPPQPRGVCCEK